MEPKWSFLRQDEAERVQDNQGIPTCTLLWIETSIIKILVYLFVFSKSRVMEIQQNTNFNSHLNQIDVTSDFL
jgi:hypothetical protein